MDLKALGEFGLISRLSSDCLYNNDEIILGVGDDTAVLPFDNSNYLLAACDMLVEDIHFVAGKISPYQLGYKAAAVNFSDVAAMGGWPTGILISVGFPKNTQLNYLDELYRGIKAICKKYNVNIIGGDTVATPNKFVINVSVLGKVKKETLRLRSHAKKGDIVIVTGALGDSAAGLDLILSDNINFSPDIKDKLIKRHLEPEPCLFESKILNSTSGLHALNDISDGLVSECNEISLASHVGIELHAEKIPISNEAKKLANKLKKDPLDWALYGGEDFQLLGTVSKDSIDKIKLIFREKLGKPLFEIGVVTNQAGVHLVKDKKKSLLISRGYNHFS